MAMPSCKIFLLLFVRFNVCYGLYPSYQSEAASVPPANTSGSQGKGGISSETIVAVVVSISVAVLIFLVGICYLSKQKRKSYDLSKRKRNSYDSDSEGTCKDPHDIQESSDSEGICASFISKSGLPQYDFITIKKATNKFSSANLVHQGAYADFYRGTLPNGQEIAVKRFITVQEFNNELEVYAKVQHRNLVIPVGFSIQGKEKILFYEYPSNQCLGQILSHPEKRRELDWAKRYKIVKGITQGIQYLHEDSMFRIIHCDIKPSNILLGNDMNPRITGFGLAVMFPYDVIERNSFMRGTIGYIAPDSLLDAKVSGKYDVYSFGVLLLEIISGRDCYWANEEKGTQENLVVYAWHLWMEGQALELLDPTIRESYNPNEVMRCIHVAMLCVQVDRADRPSMASVVIMLENHPMTLPSPSPPDQLSS